jgi:hypothetical protein
MSHQLLHVFISYSHNDDDHSLLNKLIKHLSPLQYNEPPLIKIWDDSHLLPGDPWDDEIKANLRNADIVLLLVSSDFNASRYIREIEMKEAIERGKRRECHVVPIKLRPFDHKGTPYESLEMLPKIPGTQRLEPITGEHWHDTDHAFEQVAGRLRELVESIRREKATVALSPIPAFPPVSDIQKADAPWMPFFITCPPVKKMSLVDTVNCDRWDHYPKMEQHFDKQRAQAGHLLYLVSGCETQNPTSLAKRLAYWFDEDIPLFFRPETDQQKDELAVLDLPLEKKPEQTFGKFWELMQNKILHQSVSFEDFVESPANYLPLADGTRSLLAFQVSESDWLQYKANQHIKHILKELSKIPKEQQRLVLCFIFHIPNAHGERKQECQYLLDLLDDMATDLGGLHLPSLPPVKKNDLVVWWNARFSNQRFPDFLRQIENCLPPYKLPACLPIGQFDMEDVEAMQYAAYSYQRDQY